MRLMVKFDVGDQERWGQRLRSDALHSWGVSVAKATNGNPTVGLVAEQNERWYAPLSDSKPRIGESKRS